MASTANPASTGPPLDEELLLDEELPVLVEDAPVDDVLPVVLVRFDPDELVAAAVMSSVGKPPVLVVAGEVVAVSPVPDDEAPWVELVPVAVTVAVMPVVADALLPRHSTAAGQPSVPTEMTVHVSFGAQARQGLEQEPEVDVSVEVPVPVARVARPLDVPVPDEPSRWAGGAWKQAQSPRATLSETVQRVPRMTSRE